MNKVRLTAILGALVLLASCRVAFNPIDDTLTDPTEDPAVADTDTGGVSDPEPVALEALASEANGSLEDLGWEGASYEVVNGVITYTGSYDGWAAITTPVFDLAPTATHKVVVNMDLYYDMTTNELKTVKGERIAFYMDLDGLALHFKPRTNNDPGNKYLGAGVFSGATSSEQTVETDGYFKWNNYYTEGETWYNIRFEIYESGEARALYNGTDVGLSVTAASTEFTSLVVSFRALSRSGVEYGLLIDNLTVTLEEI